MAADARPPLYVSSGPWSEPGMVDPSLVRGVVAKSVTATPRAGNPGDTIASLGPGAWCNWQGLPNAGVEAFVEHQLPRWLADGIPVHASIAARSEDEVRACARALAGSGVAAIELNLSCPNDHGEGDARGLLVAGSVAVAELTGAAPWVKLPPDPFAVRELAAAVIAAGEHVAGVVAGNSIPSVALVDGRHQPGGMSGDPLRPVALRVASELAARVEVPVLGCGGVRSGEHVAAYLAAGCVGVQVGSLLLDGPERLVDLVSELDDLGLLHGAAAAAR